MKNNKPYLSLITHPGRTLVCGKSRGGKTTEAMDIIVNHLIPNEGIEQIYVLCPSYHEQKTYAPLKKYVNNKNVHTDATDKSLKAIVLSIQQIKAACTKRSIASPKILIVIDDMAGSNLLHSNRKGVFASLAVQCTHWNTSIMVISQQPTCVDPNFRDNAENTLSFPSTRWGDIDWLQKANQQIISSGLNIKDMVISAWLGGRADQEELGQHFLFIHIPIRKKTLYFIDFETPLNP